MVFTIKKDTPSCWQESVSYLELLAGLEPATC